MGPRKADSLMEEGELKDYHDHNGRQLEERSYDSQCTEKNGSPCVCLCLLTVLSCFKNNGESELRLY